MSSVTVYGDGNSPFFYWLACRPKNLKCMPVQKGKGYMHGRRAPNVHLAIRTANCRGRYCCRVTQISYAPKALDRSLAAYLRCDLKANVFVYSCDCRAYFVKAITHVRSLFHDYLSAAHIFGDSVNNVLPPQLTMSPENHRISAVNQIFADIRWFPM